jgi:hypothetical protein
MGGMHNGEAMEAQASIDGLTVKELPDELQFRYNCNYNYGSELLIFVALEPVINLVPLFALG